MALAQPLPSDDAEDQLKIMLVGDERSAACKLRLELDGYEVLLVGLGSAPQVLRGEGRPDLVFVDGRLFTEGPTGLVAAVREECDWHGIPVILIPVPRSLVSYSSCGLRLLEAEPTGFASGPQALSA